MDYLQTNEPTAAQAERAASLKRFNRLAVYLPLVLFFLVALGIVVVLLYYNLAWPNEPLRHFTGAVANLVIILASLPLLLLCALVPLGALFAYVYGRREGYAPWQRLQRLLWGIDNGLTGVQQKVEAAAPRAAAPVIAAHARAAYLSTLFKRMREMLRRS
jgi:vacuolar-type H+-ATPase subunit I/STV1